MDLELDQFKDVYLVIDKANDSFVQKQFVSQGDYKGRSLTVQVTNNGSVGEVPGLTLNLNWHNEASGLTDLTAFTILDKANSIFRIEYPEHMMTPGKVYASIQVIQDGKVTNLQQFELIVQKLAGQPVGIPEKAEFSALVAVLADSNKFRTDIDSLSANKADKSTLESGLLNKVDKNGNEQVTLPMLSQEVKKSMTGGSVAVVGDNAVNTSNIANGAVGWEKRTPIGSQTQVQYFGTGRINFDFENQLIVIPKDTNIVVGKNNIQIGDDITTAMPNTEGYDSFILAVSLQETNFKCYANANRYKMSESEVDIAFCSNKQQTIEMNGDYLINGRARIEYAQAVITYEPSVTYKINSDGTMLVTFTKNDKYQVGISYPGVQKQVPVEANYTLKSSEALVYNSIDNSLVVLNFNSFLPDSLIIIGNYHGKVKNYINAVQGDGDYEYYLDGTENVIYYGNTVTARKNGTTIDVNFDLSHNNKLYYKNSSGNYAITVTENMYNVPHNFSLVLNRETKSLEVINTDKVIRGVHSILITCHLGFAKKIGMYFNSLKADMNAVPSSGKIPINRYETYVGQDGTKVGDEYWLFDESNPNHAQTVKIYRINPTDFSEIGLINHNLGHANGVDYRDNTLLVYNGNGFPPEINLYKNPDNTMTKLSVNDPANTQIIFKESNKLLPGDGSACFGLDNKIVYYAYRADTQVIILKILLGLGDNDLSDKTTDKSDNKHWGSFISGKSSDDYNGTAQIIMSYTGEILGDNQPQGMAFNGDLYVGISHTEQKAYQLRLFDDGSYKVVDNYKSEMTDYKNNVIGLEPEMIFIDPEKRSLFVGGRGGDSNIFVGGHGGVSNAAEFYL